MKKVICLVRGADDGVAANRVQRALEHRKLPYEPHRIQVLAARLGRPNLGLDEATYSDLARETDVVIHVSPFSVRRVDCSIIIYTYRPLGLFISVVDWNHLRRIIF